MRERAYLAILHGDRLEWVGEAPDIDGPVDVTVTVLDLPRDGADGAERRRRALAALQSIAEAGGISAIPDPVQWQREIREDRPMPGRD